MVNSLDIASLNQFGIDRKSPLESRRKAGFLFSRAKTRGTWRTVLHKLLRKENKLQDLTQVAGNVKRRSTKRFTFGDIRRGVKVQ